MTTIVVDAREGLVVADRAISCSSGTSPWTKLRKITQGEWEGAVFGASGSLSPFMMAFEMLSGSKEMSAPLDIDEGNLHEDFEVVLLTQDLRIVTFDRWLVPIEMETEYYATGSGADYAIGAMDAGASAIEAIRIACARDNQSNLLGKAPQTMRIKL